MIKHVHSVPLNDPVNVIGDDSSGGIVTRYAKQKGMVWSNDVCAKVYQDLLACGPHRSHACKLLYICKGIHGALETSRLHLMRIRSSRFQ